MYGTHVLLHISVFLFFWALSDFFYTVHRHFGLTARYALIVSGLIYILLSIFPLMFSSSPYNTPMTPPLRTLYIILRIIIRSPSSCLQWYRSKPFDLTGLPYYKGMHFDRARLYSIKAEERAENLELDAMEWLFTEDDFSDEDMDKFLEGLPGYISSSHTKPGHLDQYLTANYLLDRIKEHFITCATSVELSDKASIDRVSFCVKALWLIFQYSHKRKEDASAPERLEGIEAELHLQRTYIQELMDDFHTICDMDDPMTALRASCIRALAVQGLLAQLVSSDNSMANSDRDARTFPASLIPIYQFLFSNDKTATMEKLDDIHTPITAKNTSRRMFDSLLHDGPLANLTTLAKAVRNKDNAPPSTLSFCWKVLDILLTQLRTIHSDGPPHAQSDFDDLHENIRTYVHDVEGGFRVRPLLDILDTVGRGRRLLMVFSNHPKYCDRADIVFGKEDLRNGDLLEAFAQSLPSFISKTPPEISRDFMAKLVRHDDLWASLQVNLWNNQMSDSPTPDKLRVFDDCCTILDLAFSVLGDSEEVDWRAPEFGLLLQHFESFITHCFQGAFMGRVITFRLGIIKAQYCKALLAQFWNDIDRDGIVTFQSQWDVASLARLIYTLGLRDEEDAEFWNSYVNVGHNEKEFTAKAREMIHMTKCDGPLLIFIQLGHLAASAVPLNQSGPERKDIEKVWELQRKVIEDKRLPLDRASSTVWKALGELQEHVTDLCGKHTASANEKEFLRRLLQTIDGVINRRYSGSGQREPTEEKGPKSSVSMNSPSSSGERRGTRNRFSIASESTAVTGGPSSFIETSGGGEDGSERTNSLMISGAFINLQPERLVDDLLEGEGKTYVRSESPQSYDSIPHSLRSFYPTSQATAGVEIMMDRSRQRIHATTRRSGLGFGATRPSLVSRASSRALFALRRDAATSLSNSSIGSESPYGSFALSDDDHLGAAPAFERE